MTDDQAGWPTGWRETVREYEAEIARLRKIEAASQRLARVLDLASSTHAAERRAARIAWYEALAAPLRDTGA